MMTEDNKITLEYNTTRERLKMPEYGRYVLEMVKKLKTVEDRAKRTEQARAVVKSMEMLNPSVHQEENWEQKLWDHLHILSGYELDVDSPYPVPQPEELDSKPDVIPLKKKPVKATHYGRNIESIIDLIATLEDGEEKSGMIHRLATYMRQQYLIWNKDSVADETIFNDIVKLSEGRINIPEGMSLSRISSDASFSRPGMSTEVGGAPQVRKQNRGRGFRKRTTKDR